MALLKIKIKAKTLIQWGEGYASFIRGINSVRNVSLSYSNATGQQFTAGQVLYTYGVPGSPGYLAVKSSDNTVLNGNGVLNATVENYPTATDGNRNITFNIDEAPAKIHLTYNSQSNPLDIIIETTNRTVYVFSDTDFTSHYSDYDGDALDQIQITGDVTGYIYNGSNYVSGTWIPMVAIRKGMLTYQPQDRSDYYEKDCEWFSKDTQGN